MQNQQHFVMVAPAPGFTTRVMARIVEHERRRARQRAMLGAFALVSAGGMLVGFGAWQLGMLGWQVLTRPQVLLALVDASRVVASWLAVFLNAWGIILHTLAAFLDPARMLLMTIIVCGWVVLWAHVMANVFHLSSNYVGGLRK